MRWQDKAFRIARWADYGTTKVCQWPWRGYLARIQEREPYSRSALGVRSAFFLIMLTGLGVAGGLDRSAHDVITNTSTSWGVVFDLIYFMVAPILWAVVLIIAGCILLLGSTEADDLDINASAIVIWGEIIALLLQQLALFFAVWHYALPIEQSLVGLFWLSFVYLDVVFRRDSPNPPRRKRWKEKRRISLLELLRERLAGIPGLSPA